jgi:hypothetical protein
MAFQKPRILTDSEANTIRGKCLVGNASPEEQMQLIGHFDLVEMKLRGALDALSACLPDKIAVYGAYGELWCDLNDLNPEITEYEVIDFKEVLGEAD